MANTHLLVNGKRDERENMSEPYYLLKVRKESVSKALIYTSHKIILLPTF